MRRIAMKDGKATPNIYRAKWKNSKCYWCGVLPLNWKNCRVMFFLAGQSFWQKSQHRFDGVVFNHNFALKRKKEKNFHLCKMALHDGYQTFYLRVLKMYWFFFLFCTNLTVAEKLQKVTWIRVSILVTGLLYTLKCFDTQVSLMWSVVHTSRKPRLGFLLESFLSSLISFNSFFPLQWY